MPRTLVTACLQLWFIKSLLTEDTESKEPAFLRRLRGEYGSGDSSRHERPLARPKKHKISDDDDDEPTYVDGDSLNIISKAEYDTLQNLTEPEKTIEKCTAPLPISQTGPKERENITAPEQLDHAVASRQLEASIGGNARKRLAKVIGDDGESAENPPDQSFPSNDAGSISGLGKKGKKSKKIKLSFQEENTT